MSDYTEKLTIASRIANEYGNGQQWHNNGQHIEEACRERTLGIHGGETWQGETVRFHFTDNSAITIAEGGWDIGYPNCFCWEGVGHNNDCPYSTQTKGDTP
jgi:hypothetical protein